MGIQTIVTCDRCERTLQESENTTRCEICGKIICDDCLKPMTHPEDEILSSKQTLLLCTVCFDSGKEDWDYQVKNFNILKNSIAPCKLCKTQPAVKYNLACRSELHFTCTECGYRVTTLNYPSFYQGVRSWNSMQD